MTDEKASTSTAKKSAKDDSGLAPGPVPPRDVVVDARAHGTVFYPVFERDGDVEVDDVSLEPDPKDDREQIPVDGHQVETLTGASNNNALALAVNGHVYLFGEGAVGALKLIVDRTVAGLSL